MVEGFVPHKISSIGRIHGQVIHRMRFSPDYAPLDPNAPDIPEQAVLSDKEFEAIRNLMATGHVGRSMPGRGSMGGEVSYINGFWASAAVDFLGNPALLVINAEYSKRDGSRLLGPSDVIKDVRDEITIYPNRVGIFRKIDYLLKTSTSVTQERVLEERFVTLADRISLSVMVDFLAKMGK